MKSLSGRLAEIRDRLDLIGDDGDTETMDAAIKIVERWEQTTASARQTALPVEGPPDAPVGPASTQCDNGWWEAWASGELVEWANRRQAHGDAVKPNDMRNVASREKRARGFVAERILHRWLADQGAAFTPHGGTDPLPDVEVGGRRVAVRLCAIRGTFMSHHLVYVFERHLRSDAERFFLGYEMGVGRYLLLGGTTRELFLNGARRVERGEELVSGFRAEEALYAQPASVLTAPLEWLYVASE